MIEKDIYIGVPVKMGKNGVERVVELELDTDDKILFNESKKEVNNILNVY